MNTGPVLVDVAVKDLKGAALDWVVGVIEGAKPLADGRLRWVVGGYEVDYTPGQVNNPYMLQHRGFGYCPSTEWREGGPLLHKYKACFAAYDYGYLCLLAHNDLHHGEGKGPDHLTAACRAIVAAHLGDIVKVPACLVLP